MMNLQKQTDVQLVAKCKRNNKAAFDELFSRYDKKVTGLCYLHLYNIDDAHNLKQEVFIKAFQGMKHFSEKSSFATWIYKITVNSCFNHHRFSHAKNRNLFMSYGDMTIFHPVAKDDVLQNLISEQEVELKLNKLNRMLPSTLQDVINLLIKNDMNINEIAKELKLTKCAVRSRLYRIRKFIKNRLPKEFC